MASPHIRHAGQRPGRPAARRATTQAWESGTLSEARACRGRAIVRVSEASNIRMQAPAGAARRGDPDGRRALAAPDPERSPHWDSH